MKTKKDPKQFAKDLRKSIDFADVTVSIADDAQHYAEETASAMNVDYFRAGMDYLEIGEVSRFTATPDYEVTVCKKAEGLFSAFVSDDMGQVVQQYADVTVETLVKDMEIKGLMPRQDYAELEPEYVAEASVAVAGIAPSFSAPTCIRISLGELQVEIYKSLEAVIQDPNQTNKLRKALAAFRKSTSSYLLLKSDRETAREILDNWDLHGERFNQIIFGIDQIKKGKTI